MLWGLVLILLSVRLRSSAPSRYPQVVKEPQVTTARSVVVRA